MSKYSWVYTTWPEAGPAQAAAKQLVEARLCACANILPQGTSVYRWQGRVETATETIMILKTTQHATKALHARLTQIHPHDEPCIIALDISGDASSGGFLDWIGRQVKTPGA
jgi:periplasmic divalent cation tolerance protein